MGKREDYEAKTTELILPILDKMGFELVDVEYVKEGSDYYLRAYIDKPGGITIDDIVNVTRPMNTLLDKENFVDDAYIFEVSSPGLLRPFKKDIDFERNLGNEVELKTFKPVNDAKEFQGTLKAYTDKTVTIEFDDGEEIFDRANLSVIRLSLEF